MTIRDCALTGNTKQGVFISDKDSKRQYSKDVFILNNVISGNGVEGVLADYVRGLTIAGNTFSGNAGQAISYDPSTASGIVISGNSGV